MKLKDKINYHKILCDKIHSLYESKNNDYGDSVNDTFNRFGVDAFLVRMYDKLNRVYTLTRDSAKAKVLNEKIEDTLLDLANYALITLVELKNSKEVCEGKCECKNTITLNEKIESGENYERYF